MKYLWKLSTHYVDRDIRDTKVRSVSREQKLWRVGTHDRNEREKKWKMIHNEIKKKKIFWGI